jgi:hypothetical protein
MLCKDSTTQCHHCRSAPPVPACVDPLLPMRGCSTADGSSRVQPRLPLREVHPAATTVPAGATVARRPCWLCGARRHRPERCAYTSAKSLTLGQIAATVGLLAPNRASIQLLLSRGGTRQVDGLHRWLDAVPRPWHARRRRIDGQDTGFVPLCRQGKVLRYVSARPTVDGWVGH